MKIEAFQTLEAVVQRGSFAAAAQQMNLTASAVSMQMKQLEQYFGQPLFDRSGLQVKPTPLAREVCDAMAGGLQQLAALRHRPAIAVEGIVRLGVIESMLPVLLPATVRMLRERYPGLLVRPVRGRSSGLTNAVKAGDLDAAVVAQPEKGGQLNLHWHELESRELVLVAPPDATGSTAQALLRRHDWIRYDRDSITGAMAARYVRGLLPDKRGAIDLDSTTAIMGMVSAGLGVSVVQLAEPAMALMYPVRVVALGRGAPVLRISLVTRKGSDEDRRLLAVRDAATAAVRLPARRNALRAGGG
jgi:DNA-binding transcriptional LysR family regulator